MSSHGRGTALTPSPIALEEAEKDESKETMDEVMKEIAMNDGRIPADPLEGEWA